MQESKVTKEELFSKYKMSFFSLSSYVQATYDPEVSKNLNFEAVRDSLSDGQTSSKLWVVDEVSKFLDFDKKSVCVFGGWVGLLCRFFIDLAGTKSIANVEIDGTLELVNRYVMSGHQDKFRFIHSDMYEFPYNEQEFDVYVNTSGEHIPSLKEWIEMIPSGKIVCIQSNDYFSHPQHINCVNNVAELEAQAFTANNVKDVIYRGTLELPIYNRFMIIALT
jgi:hypothetical protein